MTQKAQANLDTTEEKPRPLVVFSSLHRCELVQAFYANHPLRVLLQVAVVQNNIMAEFE
jgi:hypothetical protein